MNAEFKVGDKVRAVAPYDGQQPAGVGTVISTSYGILEVDFPEFMGGHSGSAGGSGITTRWNYSTDTRPGQKGGADECLELVTDLPPALTEAKPPLLPIAGELASVILQETDDDMRDRIAAEQLPPCMREVWRLLGTGQLPVTGQTTAEVSAEWAFDLADAYMAERAKRRAKT